MEKLLLSGIIGSAFATRAFAIWFTRPEFVGWFNHSYYYWVQTKGLMANGRLPYEDLPLTFHLYASLASLLQLFGQDLQPSIVTASRFTMSIAPALVALPIFLILRQTCGGRPLGIARWLLVAVSAFLPLSFVHMPELLQKNALGMLLLSILLYATYAFLHQRSITRIVVILFLFALVSITHLGTLAVTLLFGASMLVALVCEKASATDRSKMLVLLGALAMVGIGAIYLLDTGAFTRIVRYVQSSLPNSLIGNLFSPDPAGPRMLLLAGIVLPLVIALYLVRVHVRCRPEMRPADRKFWLGNIVLAYSLVLPVLDLDIIPRFILFMPIPLLVVLGFHLRYSRQTHTNMLLVGLASAGVALMVFGETIGLLRLYPNKTEIHQDLLNVKTQFQLTERDFVLTTYGANPICNWFLGSRSGLITAFNQNDWNSYDRVFVLNTLERRAGDGEDDGRHLFRTASERFEAMRQDIALPADVNGVSGYEYFEFYELHEIPGNWLFDEDGNWIGWRD